MCIGLTFLQSDIENVKILIGDKAGFFFIYMLMAIFCDYCIHICLHR
jgi:hypothetical protein